jgi:cytochrome P450
VSPVAGQVLIEALVVGRIGSRYPPDMATSGVVYDPFSVEANEDPYPIYRCLRDESPLHYNDERQLWSLSRYEDIQAAARDWETFTSTTGADLDDTGELIGEGDFLDTDPPRHDELRKVVREHFTPKVINALEDRVRERAELLLEAFVVRVAPTSQAPTHGHCPPEWFASSWDFPTRTIRGC